MGAPHDHEHHAHGHAHAHTHPTSSGRAFALSVGLNVAFVALEVGFGLAAHSIALVSDAVHNLGDVLGLLLAWTASVLAQRKPSARRTYGLRRTTILASLANAVLVFVAVGAVAWEAIGRLREGAEVQGRTVAAVALAGVFVNGASALVFLKGSRHDANLRGAFVHLAADAAVSLVVVVTGALVVMTGKTWLDPLASLLVSVAILVGTWSLLRDATNLALDSVPAGIDPDDVRRYLLSLDGVEEVHDLHIWAMSTTETALTAHLVTKEVGCSPALFRDASRALEHRYRIHHVTLQVEPHDPAETCARAAEGAL
jgi:cobalt-zinc-cadmium efflux system protein